MRHHPAGKGKREKKKSLAAARLEASWTRTRRRRCVAAYCLPTLQHSPRPASWGKDGSLYLATHAWERTTRTQPASSWPSPPTWVTAGARVRPRRRSPPPLKGKKKKESQRPHRGRRPETPAVTGLVRRPSVPRTLCRALPAGFREQGAPTRPRSTGRGILPQPAKSFEAPCRPSARLTRTPRCETCRSPRARPQTTPTTTAPLPSPGPQPDNIANYARSEASSNGQGLTPTTRATCNVRTRPVAT